MKGKSYQTFRAALLKGETSILDEVKSCIKNAKQHSEHNFYVELFEEEALSKAQTLDNLLKEDKTHVLPLLGCIISIKDNICFLGHKASAGSKMLNNFRSSYSATAVQRLEEQGAIIIGRTNCDEFGMGSTNENSFYGPVKNGKDKTKVSGGSSGGAAVSVQLGCCHVALGSDTGGSVRQPASFCGVYGIKPTYGRVSRWGLISYASSFDQIGVLANNVHDMATVLEHIAGADGKDSTALNDPVPRFNMMHSSDLSYAVLDSTLDASIIEPEMLGGFQNALGYIGQDSSISSGIKFDLLDYVVPCYYILTTAEASSNLGRYDGIRYGHNSEKVAETYLEKMVNNRSEGFGLEVKRRIMSGIYVLSQGFFDVYYQKAQKVRQLIIEEIETIFTKYDILLLPTASTTAFDLGSISNDPIKMYHSDIFTVLANITGNPAISVPINNMEANMPFGMQAIAKKGNEAALISFAEKMSHMA